MTLIELLEEWMASHSKTDIKGQTVVRYWCCIDNYIRNTELAAMDIRSISKATLKTYIDSLSSHIGERTHKELSASSVRCVLAVLKLVFAYAVDKHYIDYDPCRKVYGPRLSQRQMKSFTDEELALLEKEILSMANDEYYGVLLCLYTGIRIGELAALTWDDIDFEEGTLSITKTHYHNKDKDGNWQEIENSPRTKDSNRTIPLPQFVLDDLKAIKGRSKSSYILAHKDGRQIAVRLFRWRFDQLLVRLNIRSLNFNVLRDSFSRRAVEAGMDPITLSAVLGLTRPNATIIPLFKADSSAMRKIKKISEE